jgi:type VI secretion system protein ImpB
MPAEPLPRLKDRKFVNIDRDNFNEVLKGMKPRVAMRIDNTLAKDGTQISADLSFNNIEDFEPERVVRQVEPLRKLLEVRSRLSDLKNKMYGSERLEELLQEVLTDTEKMVALGKETGHAGGDSAKDSEQEGAES